MKISLMLIVIFSLISLPSIVMAEDIILTPGSSYKIEESNIICVNPSPTPLSIKDCQHWGGYNNQRCVYEKTIYAIEGRKCVEECQYWNEKSARCQYSTECEFHQEQEIFTKTTCVKFNKWSGRCEKTKKTASY